ncbi:MAG: metallophosphoesterase family protein [Candidatus Binatus sp.]
MLAILAILSYPVSGAGLARAGASENREKPFSFVIIGCDRVLKGDKSPDNPSTANLAQLQRTFTEIAALQPPPNFVFFTGDLVLGLTADLTELRTQLESWVDVYRNSDLGRSPTIRLIALPGNHESLVGDKGSQVSNPGAEEVWLSVMRPFIAGDNGPPAGGPDHLATDQSRLSYSFDYRRTHFVILNTDPFGAIATVPLFWLADDLDNANRNSPPKHIFVLGHKQAFTPSFASSEQALEANPDLRNAFWDELNANGVGYYMVAHAHVWDFIRPVSPDDPQANHTVEIVAGNGGTKLDAKWAESGADPYFGFTRVQVMRHGRVIVTSYGRDFPADNYLAPSPPELFPTTIRRLLEFRRGQ